MCEREGPELSRFVLCVVLTRTVSDLNCRRVCVCTERDVKMRRRNCCEQLLSPPLISDRSLPSCFASTADASLTPRWFCSL